jgi:hypothetical protein
VELHEGDQAGRVHEVVFLEHEDAHVSEHEEEAIPVAVAEHGGPERVLSLEEEALGCAVDQTRVLLLLLVDGDLLEVERNGLLVNRHGNRVAELYREPVALKLLDESHEEAHVRVLENDM